jgi:NADPH:quinone reductase-like Zn-dependent oxidoreductase
MDIKGNFDVVFDAAAAYRWSQWKNRLNENGTYVTTLPSASLFVDKLKSVFSSSRVSFVSVKSRASDLILLESWMNAGLHIAIDSTVNVREVALGLTKLQSGSICGRIVVDVLNGFDS